MATTHAPSTGVAPDRGKRGRQVTIVAAVALALAAVVVPFGLRDVGDKGARAPAATHPTPPTPSTPVRRDPGVRAGVGERGELPALLPVAPTTSDGTRVRLGDVTDGV